MPGGNRLLTIALGGYITSLVAIALSYAWFPLMILRVLFAADGAALGMVRFLTGVTRRT